ncbi:MAG: hypothetical protein A3G33_06610 [Omnitrophica bacterium RIFCSPLOWO2_12_FULL_44_17]|uniref:Uncharacterized protein n=1 Tax=Candidatus Danuiimicrobium aquiferis TaxID=1801832 RepID=A0A1G1KRA9_9BACT|nr:MAG: hypothetical protein A3E74_04030 [Omnitrophica bacterium RIFCSPHIGHO2_12_FULL_44_12]OGW95494.1 MAG: hypothetical protein A3G33_06610 [Omnitrophica bacterium RIFCSPLOWO2_12_FULL_44_17]OGX01857.1 MAG: hypothetical protein A3J12_09945 [Omnitrophica bacterium RIFCSPLOWO2_02_FULL_44_11]
MTKKDINYLFFFAGYLSIFLGFAHTFGASLQTITFNNLQPGYVFIAAGIGFISILEWFERKKSWMSPIDLLSIVSFFFGFSGYIIATAKVGNLKSNVVEVSLMLASCIVSIMFGVFANRRAKNNKDFIGKHLFIMGIILSSIILFCATIYFTFEGFHIRLDLSRVL